MTARPSASKHDRPDVVGSAAAGPNVLIDTNALLLPFTTGLPLESEVARLLEGAQLAVPSSVLGELENLVKKGVPEASVALRWARHFPVVPVRERGDAGLLSVARAQRAVVVTADREFQRRLREAGVSTLGPRDRQQLELVLGRARRHSRSTSTAATVKNRSPIVRRRRSR